MTRILIGVIAGESARHSLFSACMTQLDREGLDSEMEWIIGADWCEARNTLAQMTLEGDFTHLWFMDDDHAFHPQMLKQLLSHDVPVVQPVCCTRSAPFQLVTYVSSEIGEDGRKRYLPLGLGGQEGSGLVELEAGGCAGMLIRRDVLEATKTQYRGIEGEAGYELVEGNWFEYSAEASEDIAFCEKAKGAGFKLYADLACRLGHITTAVVYPEINEGGWMTLLNIGRLNVFVDPAGLEEEMEELPPEVEDNYARKEWPEADQLGGELADMEAEASIVDTESETLAKENLEQAVEYAHEIMPQFAQQARNPCLICGKEAVAHDASGVWACAEHNGEHEVWKTYYERIEIWYVELEGNWYARALNMAGQIVQTSLTGKTWTQEHYLLGFIETYFPSVAIFHVADEMANSRTEKKFGPARLWTRDPV